MRDIALVAMTGYSQEEDRQRAQEAGFQLHLVKPVDFNKVEELLSSPPDGRSLSKRGRGNASR